MSTIEQIERFSEYAKTKLGNDASVSIDELYEQWRSETLENTDSQAVAASIRDLEQGERGEPLDSFLADFDTRRKTSKGE